MAKQDTQAGWIAKKAGALRRRIGGIGFATRLFFALTLALTLVGVFGYTLISRQLRESQIKSHVGEQAAFAKNFETIGREAAGESEGVLHEEIEELIKALGEQPGTEEALLIDSNRIVTASKDDSVIGERDSDPRIEAAFDDGTSYAGLEGDSALDGSNFEFVTPLELPSGPFVLEMSFDHGSFDAELADVRQTLLLIGLLALFGVSGLFYVFGGRSLLRSHKIALERATRDGLTDLPNHRAFQDEFEQAIASANRHQDGLALAILDLDHFKLVNDRHGHPHGDALLKRVSAILRDGRAADRAFRIGGDEFAMLLPATDTEGARNLVRRLSRTLSDDDAAVSIGVSTLRDGEPADELRAEADAALYEAKRRGGGGFALFDEIRERVAVTTSVKRDTVRRLIEAPRLEMAFQPIWDFASESLLGVEALARPDASFGLSGPAEAFDVATQIGQVHRLDEICVGRALEIGHALPADALLFLNLTPITLELDAAGNDWLLEAVQNSDLDVGRVVVEVTEKIGASLVPVVKTLHRLRDQGFKLALDDVGTGNAGLEMLRQVDAEYVKIDRSIVSASATDPKARAVLMAMATFAGQTGAFVIAEGIEDDDTLEFLRKIEEFDLRAGAVIRGGQGFRLGRPAPVIPDAPAALTHH